MATPDPASSDPGVPPGIYLVPPGTDDPAEPAAPGGSGEPPRSDPPAPAGDDPEGPPERRPILPGPLTRENLPGTLRFQAGLRGYQTAFHALRVPYYLLAYVWYGWRGGGRLFRRLMRWWHWPEGWQLESVAVAAGRPGHQAAIQAHVEGKRTRATRGRIILIFAVLTVAVLTTAVFLVPWWVWPGVAAAALLILAEFGKPAGRPLIRAAVVAPVYQPPTPEIISRALASIGIPAITREVENGPGLAFITDVHRDGDGWGVDLDLPFGVTAKQIIARREALSAGLRRPLSAVWPEPVPEEHEGRLRLWVGFTDMAKMRLRPWPLAKAGSADFFGQVPFGYDPRGRTQTAGLFELNWLIGAAPGQGKTAAVRVLGLAAALDPVCDLWVHELAGKGDLEPLAQVAHRYVSGLDDESVAYVAESLAMFRDELERRSRLFKKMTREQRPDGKLTRELAEARKDLRPIVCIIDECQVAFSHPVYGPQIRDDAGHVIRLARAYGLVLILATQRPDKEAIPTVVSGNVSARFCLKVPGHVENDLILGTSAHANGYRATVFRAKTDAGLGWLRGEADPQIVKTYYIDLPAAQKIAARARRLRQGAGVLSGYAAGDVTEAEEPRSFAADVLAIFGTDDKLWCSTIAERLADRMPGAYAAVTPAAVSSMLRDAGVPVKNVREPRRQPQQGCARADVEQAAR